jgi:hypothetical protein
MKVRRCKPELYPRESHPLGKSWEEWVELWWRWCYAEPENTSPIEDETGELMSKNQNESNVWFLGGTFGGKSVRVGTIPKQKGVLFPIINDLISFAEYSNFDNEAQLCAYAKADLDTATVICATVDGKELQNLRECRIQSNVFNLLLPIRSSDQAVIKKTKCVSDGYWAFLKPLPIGVHTVSINGKKALYDDGQNAGKFMTKVNYHIIVK